MRKIWFAFVLVSVLVGVTTFAWSAVFYVTPTSDNDCSDFSCDFQSALNAASLNDEGDTIYLGAGTYDASASQFVWNTGKNFPFTIIGSDGAIINGSTTSRSMYIETTNQLSDDNSHVTIQNLIFQNGNQPVNSGGSLFARTTSANVTVDNCSFTNNIAADGGGAYVQSQMGTLLFRNNTFRGNTATNAYGGGIWIDNFSGTVSIEKNSFFQNSATNGGGIYVTSQAGGDINFVNNLVYTNTAQNIAGGAGLNTTSGTVSVTNNTVTANTAGSWGGISVSLTTYDAVANIYNNIIWNNTAANIGRDIYICDNCNLITTTAIVNLYNNDFTDFSTQCMNTGCTPRINQSNNKNVDPQLINVSDLNPVNWNLCLESDSGAIDAGDNTMCALTDIRAISRPQDGNKDGINICDMGAYEILPVELSAFEGTIGTMLAITGSGFGDKKGKVLIDNTAAKIINWSPASITTEIKKALSPGIAYDVVVKPREPKGIAPITLTKAFTTMEPVITSVDPGTGTEEIAITIRGNYFSTKKGKVYLGEKKCKVLSWEMDKITFTVPRKMAPGPYDVIVTNKVGSVTLTDGFIIP